MAELDSNSSLSVSISSSFNNFTLPLKETGLFIHSVIYLSIYPSISISIPNYSLRTYYIPDTVWNSQFGREDSERIITLVWQLLGYWHRGSGKTKEGLLAWGRGQGKLPRGSDAKAEFWCACVLTITCFPECYQLPLCCPPLMPLLIGLSCQESSRVELVQEGRAFPLRGLWVIRGLEKAGNT